MRIQDNPLVVGRAQTNGEREFEHVTTRLTHNPALESRANHVQFGLTHGPLQTKQQPIIERGGIVEPILIQDQGLGQGAHLEHAMPIAGIAGQPRDLQAQDEADAPQSHLRHQPLESEPVRHRCSRVSQILVDDDDLVVRPAQCDRPLAERILACGAFAMRQDLLQRPLTDVQTGKTTQLFCSDLVCHVSPPPAADESDQRQLP